MAGSKTSDDGPLSDTDLAATLGTRSESVQLHLCKQLARLRLPEEQGQEAMCRGAALLEEVKPRTALESLLVVQMIAAHELAIEFSGRALKDDVLPHLKAHANLAAKLQRTFVAQVEALERLRGRKSEQTVTVRHVAEGENVLVGEFGEGG